jgi:hypothetical protein
MIKRFPPLALLIFAGAAWPAEGSRPASFDHPEPDRQFAKVIVFPREVKGKVELVLDCVARIQPSGRLKETGCYSENQYEQAFTSQVIKASSRARMIPALVNGKPYETYMQFRIAFAADEYKKKKIEVEDEDDKKAVKAAEKEAEKTAQLARNMRVRIFPNPGYQENVLAYGIDHVAGQRVIGKNEPWNEACPSRAHYRVIARAYLGEDGRADNPSIEFGNGIRPIASCLDAIKQTLVDSLYTPAMSEGAAVPSTYVELFGN